MLPAAVRHTAQTWLYKAVPKGSNCGLANKKYSTIRTEASGFSIDTQPNCKWGLQQQHGRANTTALLKGLSWKYHVVSRVYSYQPEQAKRQYGKEEYHLTVKKNSFSFTSATPQNLILELNISFLLFTGYENEHGSCAVFHQHNAWDCELLFSLRWRDRVLFANVSWFVNKFPTTCIQINQPSSCHMALLFDNFSGFTWKAITHSTKKASWFDPPTNAEFGSRKKQQTVWQITPGEKWKNLLDLSNWVTRNRNVQNQHRLQVSSSLSISLLSANLVTITPYVPTESYYFHIYGGSNSTLWSPALFRGWSCYGLFM